MMVAGSAWWRVLTPLAWVGVVVVLVLILALFSDPFGLRAKRLERAEQAAAAGRVEAELRRSERQAQQEVSRHQGELQARDRAVDALTRDAIETARGQGDAKTPLGEDRYRRLREHDRRLCEQATNLGGCAT